MRPIFRRPKPRPFHLITAPYVNYDSVPHHVVIRAEFPDPPARMPRPIYCRMTIEAATAFRDSLTRAIEQAKG